MLCPTILLSLLLLFLSCLAHLFILKYYYDVMIDFMLLAGKPINERVVASGSMVMNTQDGEYLRASI